jgi:hypothetical protein
MKQKKLIKGVLWGLSITVVLLIVLIIHIVMVTKPVKFDNNNLQLTRINFNQVIDSAEAIKIRHYIASLPGVKNSVVNLEQKTLVIGFLNTEQTSDNLIKQLVAFGNYKVQKFVPEQNQLTSGCPVGMGNNSLSYKITTQINKWFN